MTTIKPTRCKVVNCASSSKALSNCVYMNIDIENNEQKSYLLTSKRVYLIQRDDTIKKDSVAMSNHQRKECGVSIDDVCDAEIIVFSGIFDFDTRAVIEVMSQLTKSNSSPITVDCDVLRNEFMTQFVHHVFMEDQTVLMRIEGVKGLLHLKITNIVGNKINFDDLLIVNDGTKIDFRTSDPPSSPRIILSGNTFASGDAGAGGGNGADDRVNNSLFKSEFDFEKLGIGGLDTQFTRMFRTAFASRMFPGVVRDMDTNHVRGLLLYGPPGCGKTLIARQIGKILNAREPKIVNGPEILNKYVGESESKIRALFAEAEREQREMGDASMLHIIIFDEMDAIMKSRSGSGGGTAGVNDSIVNQLLSKIDGVDSLNNILIIGMTNRKDLIDEAILRPGRLEIHIEVGLPDTRGRTQILNIKTAKMKSKGRITDEAASNLGELAEMTKNFTGAELEGLVRGAVSFALARNIDPKAVSSTSVESSTESPSEPPTEDTKIKVEWSDFQRAFSEMSPAFGGKGRVDVELKQFLAGGLIDYGENYRNVVDALDHYVEMMRGGDRGGDHGVDGGANITNKFIPPVLSVLVDGPSGSGKSAIVADIVRRSEFNFVRLITPSSVIGMSETHKSAYINKIFTDAYLSPLSFIFIDDIERIIEFSNVGPRFSNTVLQTLLTLMKTPPPNPAHRLLIFTTTSRSNVVELLDISDAFHFTETVPLLTNQEEVDAVLDSSDLSSSTLLLPISIKSLLIEKAKFDVTASASK